MADGVLARHWDEAAVQVPAQLVLGQDSYEQGAPYELGVGIQRPQRLWLKE